ncbi:MAG TPA: sigma-E factor negative regulatory protein, partial [Burkholderiaceae bacterium]
MDASERDVAALERLSALVDGELDGRAAAQACADWRESGEARSSWHAYQLIGDVLRSDDLAEGSVGDAAFLQTLRARLSAEPVVLAPQRRATVFARPATPRAAGVASAAALRGRWSWRTSSAVAAGVMLVAGAVTLTRGPGAPAGPQVAQLAPSSGAI